MKKIVIGTTILLIIIIGLIDYFVLVSNNPFFKKSADITAEISKEVVPQKPENKEVSLIAVGDIMLSRGVAVKMAKNGTDYPFLKVGDYLKTGNIVFANLETPISEGRAILPGEMYFRTEPGLEKQLKANNFSILSLANNHTGNFGTKGLEQTFKYLNEAGIKYVGAGENANEANAPIIIESNGLKFAFLAYTDIDFTPAEYGATDESAGVAFMDKEKMATAIIEAKKQADFVIVSMHAGNEYQTLPSDKQIEYAHLAIDSGAELVIGHHPHVVEPIEKYNGKYIFYSLGNFIFDQMWSMPTREGVIEKITFDKAGVKSLETKVVRIDDYAQPNIIESPEADSVLKILNDQI
jgi:poly-gamma-glutamate synthesis protein (capsule biosynthesis protein)